MTFLKEGMNTLLQVGVTQKVTELVLYALIIGACVAGLLALVGLVKGIDKW